MGQSYRANHMQMMIQSKKKKKRIHNKTTYTRISKLIVPLTRTDKEREQTKQK